MTADPTDHRTVPRDGSATDVLGTTALKIRRRLSQCCRQLGCLSQVCCPWAVGGIYVVAPRELHGLLHFSNWGEPIGRAAFILWHLAV